MLTIKNLGGAVGLFLLMFVGSALAEVGPETGLPMPRFVSMKANEGNVRRGPSRAHRIDWVFVRRGMPLMVTAEHGHWRRVEDRDGIGGWIHYTLISGTRTVIVDRDMLAIHAKPDETSSIKAHLELGVIAKLGECQTAGCRVTAGGFRGWAPQTALWGINGF